MDIKEKVLLRNSLRCMRCDTEIISRHKHDFVCCNCEENGICVDGGITYQRIVLKGDTYMYQNTSVYDDGKHETRRNNMCWGVNFDKLMNRLPETEWTLIKDLETSHIENILSKGFVKENPFYTEVFTNELSYRRLLTENP